MWIDTYSKITSVLYADDVAEEDLKIILVISEIAALRRGEVVPKNVVGDFLEAVESAVRDRLRGQMPPDKLKKNIRRLFLNS